MIQLSVYKPGYRGNFIAKGLGAIALAGVIGITAYAIKRYYDDKSKCLN